MKRKAQENEQADEDFESTQEGGGERSDQDQSNANDLDQERDGDMTQSQSQSQSQQSLHDLSQGSHEREVWPSDDDNDNDDSNSDDDDEPASRLRPKFFCSNGETRNPDRGTVQQFKDRQLQQLLRFRKRAEHRR
jgi:hypothetical protein